MLSFLFFFFLQHVIFLNVLGNMGAQLERHLIPNTQRLWRRSDVGLQRLFVCQQTGTLLMNTHKGTFRVSQTARCSFLVHSREIYFAKTLHVTTKSWCVLQILWNPMAIQHTSFCSCFKIQKNIMTHLDYALLLIDILINQYIILSKINYCSPNINIYSILNSSYFAVLDMEN